MTIPSIYNKDEGNLYESKELIKTSSAKALTLLAKARSADWERFIRSKDDPDLNPLRGLAEFQQLYHPSVNISGSK